MITETTRSLALWITDFPNRYYRYPFVKIFFRPLYYTPITPNQISLFHIMIGLLASYYLAMGTLQGLWVAFILYEFRSLLDCFDGVLARWKNMSSVFGRHIDEISDVISSIGMLIASGIYFSKQNMDPSYIWIILGVGFTLLVMGNVYDFYRRKIVSVLTTGEDQFINELWDAKEKLDLNPTPTLFSRVGFFLDLIRCRVFTPKTYQKFISGHRVFDQESKKLLIYAEKNPKKIRTLLQVCSLSTGDMGLFLLHLGMLFGALYEFYFVVFFMGWFFIFLSLGMVYRFFRNVHEIENG